MTREFTSVGTIGVEEEFYAVHPDSLMPAPASEDMLVDPPGEIEERFTTELFKFVLETQTEKCWSLAEARSEIRNKRRSLLNHARSHGYELLAAGLHPSAEWYRHEHIEKERYQNQLMRIGYPQWRNITAGLHVHIGMDDPDKAVWVCDEIRRYLPGLLALSANSPFWCGYRTGLQSTRAVVFENLPNTGIPSALGSWEEFQSFEERMVRDGSIRDEGEIWWDVRPNPRHGTVEVRAMDSQSSEERVFGFVVLVYSLAMHLARRYDKDREPLSVKLELLDENKWRAARHGRDADFVSLTQGYGVHSLRDYVSMVLDFVDERFRDSVEALYKEPALIPRDDSHEGNPLYGVCEAIRVNGS